MKNTFAILFALIFAVPVYAQTVTFTVNQSDLPPGPPGPRGPDGVDGVTPDLSDIYARLEALEAGQPSPDPDPDPIPDPIPDPAPGGDLTLDDIDLNVIPWHTSSGPWGPAVPLQLPAQPVTTRSVTVTTASQFNTEAANAGTEITIGASWSETAMAQIRANDIDVIIPAGVSIGMVEIGAWPRNTPHARIRIRGEGRMGQLRVGSIYSDVTLDGIDMNGASPFGGGETNQGFRVGITRFAVLNVRAISAGYVWLGEASHVLIVNSNFYHGAAQRSDVGFPEGWGLRNLAGPFAMFNSRIEGTRYVNLRLQSSTGSGELFYAGNTDFVAPHESRNIWVWDNLGNTSTIGNGLIVEDSRFYSYSASGCWSGVEIRTRQGSTGPRSVAYARIDNSQFYSGGTSAWSQSYLDSALDENSGNSFHSFDSIPDWGGPGDPTEIPLPGGLSLNTAGDSPCTYP